MDFYEIVLIVGVAFVVLKPKDLPRILYTLGRWIAKFKAAWQELAAQGKALVEAEELELYKEKALKDVKELDDAQK